MIEQGKQQPNRPPNNDSKPLYERAKDALANYPVGSPEYQQALTIKENIEKRSPELLDSANTMTESNDEQNLQGLPSSGNFNESNHKQLPQHQSDTSGNNETFIPNQTSVTSPSDNSLNVSKPATSEATGIGGADKKVQDNLSLSDNRMPGTTPSKQQGDGTTSTSSTAKNDDGQTSTTATDNTNKDDKSSTDVSAESSQQPKASGDTSVLGNKLKELKATHGGEVDTKPKNKLDELKEMLPENNTKSKLEGCYGQENDQNKGNTEIPNSTELPDTGDRKVI